MINDSTFVDGFISKLSGYPENIINDVRELLSNYTLQYDITPSVRVPMNGNYLLPEVYELYISAMKQNGRMTASTEQQYRMCIKKMLLDIRLPVDQININHIRTHLSNISVNKDTGRPICQSTLNQRKSIIRSFFAFCAEEGYTDVNPTLRIKRTKYESKPREAIADTDIEKIRNATIQSHEKRSTSLRDVAIIDLLLSSGIRVSELVNLNISDVDLVNREFVVFGKGNKYRTAYMDARSSVSIQLYLNSRDDDNEALFVAYSEPHDRLKQGGVRKSIKKHAKSIGIHNVYPHKYRHTMATRAINHGMPVTSVQKLLGHKNLNTTMKYSHVSDDTVRNDHRKYVQH